MLSRSASFMRVHCPNYNRNFFKPGPSIPSFHLELKSTAVFSPRATGPGQIHARICTRHWISGFHVLLCQKGSSTNARCPERKQRTRTKYRHKMKRWRQIRRNFRCVRIFGQDLWNVLTKVFPTGTIHVPRRRTGQTIFFFSSLIL